VVRLLARLLVLGVLVLALAALGARAREVSPPCALHADVLPAWSARVRGPVPRRHEGFAGRVPSAQGRRSYIAMEGQPRASRWVACPRPLTLAAGVSSARRARSALAFFHALL